MQFLEKLWKMWENIKLATGEINLYRKEKKLFSIRTKLSHYEVFHGKFISKRNEKNSNINN